MSNYYALARKPDMKYLDGLWEKVEMLDDYFGSHQYGVRFPDGEIYRKEDCIIKKDK